MFRYNSNRNVSSKFAVIVLLLFLSISSCGIGLVSSLKIQDISPNKIPSKIYAGSNDCSYSFFLLCTIEDSSQSCDNIVTLNGVQSFAQYITLASNATSSVISLKYIIPPSATGFSFTFLSNPSFTTETYYCLQPDFSNVQVNVLKTFIYPNLDVMGFGTIVYFELKGLQADVSYPDISGGGTCINFSPCILSSTSQNSNFILKLPYISTVDIPNTIQFNISTKRAASLFYTLEIPIVRETYQLFDIKTYPSSSSLSQIELFGAYSYPLLSLRVNTTVDKGFPYVKRAGVSKINSQVFPIGGDENSTIYLFPMAGNGASIFEIFYQSGSNTIKLSTTFQADITNFGTGALNRNSSNSQYSISSVCISEPLSNYISPISTKYSYNNFEYFSSYPYGFTFGNGESYVFNVSFPIKSQLKSASNTIAFNFVPGPGFVASVSPSDTTFIYDQNNSPIIKDIDTIKLGNSKWLFRVSVNTFYKFAYFLVDGLSVGYESLISGDVYSGTFEFVVKSQSITSFAVYDQAGGSDTVGYGKSISISPLKFFWGAYNPKNEFDIYSIQNVSYLYNNLDITNFTRYNVLYFNYSQSVSRDTSFTLYLSSANSLSNILKYRSGYSHSFTSKWNSELKLFEIEFFIEANTGEFNFVLVSPDSSNQLYSQTLDVQLVIKKTLIDYYGPIFKEIKKVIPSKVIPNKSQVIGWKVKIEDSINGFDYGYVIVRGSIDQSIYNISINSKSSSDGTKYLGSYDFNISVSYPCKSQDYVISQVVLYDVMGRASYFSEASVQYSSLASVYNPFIHYLQDKTINRVTLECENDLIASVDTTPPELSSFLSSTTEIDVNSASARKVDFVFSAIDQESGIKNNVYPIVYLSNSNNQVLECKSSIVEFRNKSVTYKCSIEVPLGFGYPDSIYLSIYGFTNNNGLFSGYSTLHLIDMGYPFIIATSFGPTQLVLVDSDTISSRGGSLLLYGRGFEANSNAYITYGRAGDSQISMISYISGTVVSVPNIQPTNQAFSIYIQNSKSKSNTLIIQPIIYQYNISQVNCNNGISNSIGECTCNNNWLTIDPSNPCLVPDHYISASTQVSATTGGDIQLDGFFGEIHLNPILYIDNKLSNIINISSTSISTKIAAGNIGPVQISFAQNGHLWSGIIYPYLINQIECPSKCSINGECDKSTGKCICKSGFTGIDCTSPINSNNNNTESQVENNGTTIIKNQDVGYSISIESIIELDLNNNMVSSFNLTNNWVYVGKVGSITTFNQTRDNIDQTKSLILLIIEEVNDQDKDFSFAGNQFTVTKGGFKLSLSISNWQYSSNLNILQVQVSSDLKINSDNCNNNNKAIIESSSNNNYLRNNINYLKVIKNGRALYARFQDKILSNNKTSTVLAQLVSSSNDSVKVLLTLPHCDECLIDPDFSLLITQDYKSSCGESRKKWVIAVVVVASVVGASMLLVSIFLFYRKTTSLKIKIYSIKKKLKNRDN